MAKRFLEIGYKNKQRLGFYTAPEGAVELTVVEWIKKPGDIIEGKENRASGKKEGERVVELLSSEKGSMSLEAIDWEVGAKIVEILEPVGSVLRIDFSKDVIRLAVLEITEEEEPVSKETEPIVSRTHSTRDIYGIPISPQALRVAEEKGVDLEMLARDLSGKVSRITKSHVEAYLKSKPEVLASPAVRRFAKENGLNLEEIHGTGPRGIKRRRDVEAKLAEAESRVAETSSDEFEDWEIEIFAPEVLEPTHNQLAVARNLRKARDEMVLVGGGRDFDFINLMSLRAKVREAFERDAGVERLRFDHFFVAAVAKALRIPEFEKVNARWERMDDGRERIVLYRHVNIALAIAAPTGLVTPVIKHAESKSFAQLARDADELISKAFEGKLTLVELSGMTITVNNVGAFGDEYPSPIPNPRTAAIIAFGAARQICLCPPEAFKICGHRRPAMMRVSFDHQLLNGQDIGPFMAKVKEFLENPEQLLYL